MFDTQNIENQMEDMKSTYSMTPENSMDNTEQNVNDLNPLSDKWTLYAHLPHDTDWSISSYKSILEMNHLEEAIALFESIPEKMTQNCMLFLMKNDIKPTWEDPENCKGGSFSFKVATKDVHTTWKEICYTMIGKTITHNDEFLKNINGITISPKRNFCIVKFWTKDASMTEMAKLIDIRGINTQQVQFKKHNPEY